MDLSTFRIEMEDRLRYNKLLRSVLSIWHFTVGKRLPLNSPQKIVRSIDRLCFAARLAVRNREVIPIENQICRRVALLGTKKFDWHEFEPSANVCRIEKAIVLKPPVSKREKGVLYMSFEDQWVRLMQNCDPRSFSQQYDLVLAPVWASPHSPVNFILPAVYPGRVFSHLSDPNDATVLPRISNKYYIVPLLCSSWVNPDLFQKREFGSKDIDIMMLANFGKYKRHHHLFAALRKMPGDIRVILVGQPNEARTLEVLLSEARAYGVHNRLEVRCSVSDQDVLDALSRSKISLILSRREGSCVAVAESLFADTPVGMLADAKVGSRIFINSQTGRFLQREGLARQLLDFLDHAEEFNARQWALENGISCYNSSATLNEIVRVVSLSAGDPWTQDLAPFHWRPNPVYIHDEDGFRMRGCYEDIQQRYGIEVATCHSW
jgi:glycosyltransferase involved in cell wall biosynthesis